MLNISFRQTLITHLEFKVSHDGNQIGIAATFTDTIDCPLHLNCAFTNCNQGVDNRALGVVMRVDSEWVRESRLELPNDVSHFPGQCAAVSVTQNDSFRTATNRPF